MEWLWIRLQIDLDLFSVNYNVYIKHKVIYIWCYQVIFNNKGILCRPSEIYVSIHLSSHLWGHYLFTRLLSYSWGHYLIHKVIIILTRSFCYSQGHYVTPKSLSHPLSHYVIHKVIIVLMRSLSYSQGHYHTHEVIILFTMSLCYSKVIILHTLF